MSEAAMDMHETYKDMPGFHRQSHVIPSGYIHHMQYHGPMDHVKPAVRPHPPHHEAWAVLAKPVELALPSVGGCAVSTHSSRCRPRPCC